jgi:hypothetical protein
LSNFGDQLLALAGLAFVLSAPEEGQVIMTGFNVAVPFDVFERFLSEGKIYLAEYIAAMPKPKTKPFRFPLIADIGCEVRLSEWLWDGERSKAS